MLQFFILFLLTLSASLHAMYDLSIVAIFQNEAPYLKEWIEYHKLVGVQHFYLFNNLSTDGFEQVLEPYIKNGEVELVNVPVKTSSGKEFFRLQKRMYTRAVHKSKKETRWLAIIDLDEFIVPVKEDNLVHYLDKNFKEYSALRANWQIYGTSNVPYLAPGKIMIEQLTMKAGPGFRKHNHWKSIVRPQHVQVVGIHSCKLKEGYEQVNANKDVVLPRTKTGSHINDIRINHYITRDQSHYEGVKLPRLLNRNPKHTRENLLKEVARLSFVHDPVIMRFVPALKERMGLSSP